MALLPTPSRLLHPTVDASAIPSVSWAPPPQYKLRARRGAIAVPPPSCSASGSRPTTSPTAASVPIAIKQPDERMRSKIRDRVRRDPHTDSAKTISSHLGMEQVRPNLLPRVSLTGSALPSRARGPSPTGAYSAVTALLADGERCSNHVPAPSKWNVCFEGWHEENDRSSHVSDLLVRRRQWDHHDSAQAAEQRAELASLFDSLCPDLATAAYPQPLPPPSAASLTATSTSSPSSLTAARQSSDHASSSSEASTLLRTPRLGARTQWSEVEIDDAWIENWGLKLPLAVTVTPASVNSTSSTTTLTGKPTPTWV